MYMGCMLAQKMKTPDRNDLKPDTVSKPIDFGFKRSGTQGRHFEMPPSEQK